MSKDTQSHYHHTGELPGSLMARGYWIRISNVSEDPAWDDFVAEAPDGHYVQTSLWAKAKALLNWRAVRIVVMREKHVVAGAQMLIRSFPLVGAVGYVPKGPLNTLNKDDFELTKHVIDQLHQVARKNGVRYLAVQPPNNGEALARQLPSWGFQPSSRELTPTATILLDLSKDLNEILAQMRRKTRYNIRLGQRKGVVVREGTEDDLTTFYRLLSATGQRRQFSSPPEAYFSNMWRIFQPRGYIKMFLAEYDGEAVSTLLAISFGNTVTLWRGGWSGRHDSCRPNEVIHWAAISWAKAQGYRFCDFEGLDPEVAESVTLGETLPDSLRRTPSFFKLGFGGQVTHLPPPYDHIYNPFLRWSYASVLSKASGSVVITKVEDALRGIRRR